MRLKKRDSGVEKLNEQLRHWLRSSARDTKPLAVD
jgi:IS1 family transposase